MTAVDDWAARVLRHVDELGLRENTIVVFSSDHGDMLGSHHLFNKNQHYQEATRIPLLVRWTGRIRPAIQDEQIISLVDVMPTILELCGVPRPPSVQGDSLAPLLLGGKTIIGDNAAYIETTAHEGVRMKRYVYWRNRKNLKGEHLFDVEKDPYETRDVIADPSYQRTLARLRGMTDAWRERTPSVPFEGHDAASRPASVPARTPATSLTRGRPG